MSDPELIYTPYIGTIQRVLKLPQTSEQHDGDLPPVSDKLLQGYCRVDKVGADAEGEVWFDVTIVHDNEQHRECRRSGNMPELIDTLVKWTVKATVKALEEPCHADSHAILKLAPCLLQSLTQGLSQLAKEMDAATREIDGMRLNGARFEVPSEAEAAIFEFYEAACNVARGPIHPLAVCAVRAARKRLGDPFVEYTLEWLFGAIREGYDSAVAAMKAWLLGEQAREDPEAFEGVLEQAVTGIEEAAKACVMGLPKRAVSRMGGKKKLFEEAEQRAWEVQRDLEQMSANERQLRKLLEATRGEAVASNSRKAQQLEKVTRQKAQWEAKRSEVEAMRRKVEAQKQHQHALKKAVREDEAAIERAYDVAPTAAAEVGAAVRAHLATWRETVSKGVRKALAAGWQSRDLSSAVLDTWFLQLPGTPEGELAAALQQSLGPLDWMTAEDRVRAGDALRREVDKLVLSLTYASKHDALYTCPLCADLTAPTAHEARRRTAAGMAFGNECLWGEVHLAGRCECCSWLKCRVSWARPGHTFRELALVAPGALAAATRPSVV